MSARTKSEDELLLSHSVAVTMKGIGVTNANNEHLHRISGNLIHIESSERNKVTIKVRTHTAAVAVGNLFPGLII